MRIAVFGTVGAGKTSLIEELLKLLPKDYEVYLEPMTNNPYFKDVYTENNTNDIQYKMELWMLANRMKQLTSSLNKDYVLFDRGVADTLIFADANYELQKIDKRDYDVYEEYFNKCIIPTIFDKKTGLYDLMIYLRVSDETSIQHIQSRGLKAELEVDNAYWKMLNQKYDFWYEQWKEYVPFYVLDGNVENSQQLALRVVNDLKLNETKSNNSQNSSNNLELKNF